MPTDIVIYHNPKCGTSRNTLAMIRNAGIEPHVVEYLETPPSRAMLESLMARAGLSPRELLREKGTPHAELGLGDESLSDTALVDAMMEHPIHLHGMWMELENGHGERIPRKHTISVRPGERLSVLVNADAPGRWAFHCHLLYHMAAGMFRVVEVSPYAGANA